MDKASFFLLNVFLNSFLAFFTVVFLLEGVIFLFRIRPGRTAAFLRMLPILKLPFDLYLYNFSKWSYTYGINPWDSGEGTRNLSVKLGYMSSAMDTLHLPISSGIQFSISDNLTFTLADAIGYILSPTILRIFLGVFLLLTVYFLLRKLFLYRRSLIALESLAKSSKPLHRKIHNSALSSSIKKCSLPILTSPAFTGSPFVAGLLSSIVYIPKKLSQNLSEKEYEAVLAHEIEHIRYKDTFVRLVLDFIGTIFWWVPTKWLRNRIEEGQEIGCDLTSKKYGINPTDLASAVYKSAKHTTYTPKLLFAFHLTKHTVLKRLHILLNPTSIKFKKVRFAFTCLAIVIAFLVIFLGRFWTF